ncbi:MAG: methylated-DNA--protein-cysteine methyltransferase [Candidatus Xenobia bacterium]
MLTMESPLGPLTLTARHNRLVEILFGESSDGKSGEPVLHEARRQLEEYFAGSRRTFDLPLGASGTPFQMEVWSALIRIPFGQTASYAEVAQRIGRPRAVRAVGAANARNPLAIVVPCHRVIGSDGQLTGYAGGLEIKRWLLAHEGDKS